MNVSVQPEIDSFDAIAIELFPFLRSDFRLGPRLRR